MPSRVGVPCSYDALGENQVHDEEEDHTRVDEDVGCDA